VGEGERRRKEEGEGGPCSAVRISIAFDRLLISARADAAGMRAGNGRDRGHPVGHKFFDACASRRERHNNSAGTSRSESRMLSKCRHENSRVTVLRAMCELYVRL